MIHFKLRKKTLEGKCCANRCSEEATHHYGGGGPSLCDRHEGMLEESEREALTNPKSDEPDPGSEVAIKAYVEPIQVDALSMAEQFEAIEIRSDGAADSAAEVMREIHDQVKELETRRKSVVGPLNKVIKNINGWFKPATTALNEAKGVLKHKLEGFQLFQETERLAALEDGRVEDALEITQREAPAGMQRRKTWTFEVEDIDKVPASYMMVNEAMISAAIKNTDPETLDIAGIRIYQKETLAMGRG